MKKIIIKIIIIILFSSIGLIIGIVTTNTNNFVEKTEDIKESKNFDTFGLVIKDKNNKNTKQIVLNQNNNIFDYNIDIVLPDFSDNSMFLSIYLNYEQIPFSVEDHLENYLFKLDDNQQITLPISFKINNQDSSNMVNFVITSHPTKNIYNNKEIINNESYIMLTRHLLINNSSVKDFKEPIFDKPNTIVLEDYMNVSLNAKVKNKDLNIEQNYITAKPNQIINIPIIAGGYNGDNKYLIWMSMDWKQIKISNQNKYYYFKTFSSRAANINTSIAAPNKPGKYEICAYMAVNPWNNNINNCMAIEASNRITLIVKK